jgi:FeS assembly SUF system regulator
LKTGKNFCRFSKVDRILGGWATEILSSFTNGLTMIKLSRLTDYAIVLLTQMALEGKGVHAASTLAERTFLPLPTVSKVLKQLTKAGIISAQRGASGGYSLAREPSAVSMASLIEALDGPIAITDCAGAPENEPRCSVQSTCPAHGNWDRVNIAIRAALEAVTLADMTAKGGGISASSAAQAN